MRFTLAYVVVVAFAAGMLLGCDGDEETVPSVIPTSAFSLRTDLFNLVVPGAGDHFTAAQTRVAPTSAAFNDQLAVARTVSQAAASLDPESIGDGWVWSGATLLNDEVIEFDMQASRPRNDVVTWSMRVTFDDGTTSYNDFEMLTARAFTSATLGEWELYDRIDGVRTLVFRAQFGALDFDRFLGIAVEDSVSLEIAGDSLEYSEFTGGVREFLWFDRSSFIASLVQWNVTSREGLFVAADYNDGATSCWDTALADREC